MSLPWSRKTVRRDEGFARAAAYVAPQEPALRAARRELDSLTHTLADRADAARAAQANSVIGDPENVTRFRLAESAARVRQRGASGPAYQSATALPPRGKGRRTLPDAERSSGDASTSFFANDMHNKVRKLALYQAWLGESWASASIDAIASRIISGGWMLEPANKKKPDARTKWWVQDYFDWCNADEEFHSIVHSGITDLGWCGECYLEVTWRYNRTMHREIPYELYTVDPISMEYVLSDDRRRIVGYKQMNDMGQPIHLDPKQIIRVWFPDPRNRIKALSPLEKLLNPLVLDMYLQASDQKYFQQGNRGDVAILAKRADRTAAVRLLEFIEEHALGLKNAHRPFIIYGDNDDIEIQPLPGRDTMDVPGRRDGVRKEIAGNLHVPPHQLGIIEGGSVGGQGATYVMEKQFVHTGTDPYKQRYFSQLNFSLINVGFGVDDWSVGAAYADLRDDTDITAIEKEQIFSGLTTINAVLATHKQEPITGGDVPFLVVGTQIIPVSHLTELAAAPAQPPSAPAPLPPPGTPGAMGTGQGTQRSSAGVTASATKPAGDNKRDSEGRPKRSEVSESMDNTVALLLQAGKKIKHCGDCGYGFFKPDSGEVWWVDADSDGDPHRAFTSSREIQTLLSTVPGVRQVTVAYEGHPSDYRGKNDTGGWLRFRPSTGGA